MTRIKLLAATIALAAVTIPQPTVAQGPSPTFDPALFREMQWRNIGPHRASRTEAIEGVESQPHTFYMGVVNGGVWKTTDAGRTWQPIFDDQPTGCIGAIAVAPSNPDVIYVGAGEAQQRPDLSTGDGDLQIQRCGQDVDPSAGLRDSQQISKIAVDTKDPNRLFVAVLGHPYGPNTERGIFRSTDGGAVVPARPLPDENTGASDVLIDPKNPQVVYASLWQARQGPWENGDFRGPGSGFYKSTDGGTTWRQITKGLPAWEPDRLGRIGLRTLRQA